MQAGIDGLPLTTPKTGVGHYTFELAQALAAVDPSSSFTLVYPSTYREVVFKHDGARLAQNLKLRRVRVGPLGRHWWSAGLPRFIRRSKLDLFHGTNYDIPLWRTCATVLTIHDLSLLLYPNTHEQRAVRRAQRRLPMMVRSADAIITPTETVRREVCERLSTEPGKVFAIAEAPRECFQPLPFGESSDVRQKLGIGNRFLLSVSTLEPRKNLSMLVDAFAEAIRERADTDLQLVIAGGRGWLSEPLFAAIEESPVRNRIVLTDYLYDEDLRALYASCLAFIYPSLYEGFGLPPLEAMACGAPVIASRTPAIMETTGEAALFFDPRNLGELIGRILELLDNEHGERARQTLSTSGTRRAKEFSWEQSARLTLNVYSEALRRFQS